VNAQVGTPVSTFEELNTTVRSNLAGSYYLTNDIEIPEGTEWLPIGKPEDWDGNANNLTNFTGTFDGRGYSIKNLKITTGSNMSGLFSRIVDCTIKNLGIENVDITGGVGTGGLAGIMFGSGTTYNPSVTIENVFVTGSVKGATQVGGLVGQHNNNPENTIRNCYVNALVEATNVTGAYAGGIVGNCQTGRRLTIKKVYAAGTVKTTHSDPSNFAGGILGHIYNNQAATIIKFDSTVVLLDELAGSTNGIFLNRGNLVLGTVSLTGNYARNNLGITSTGDGTLLNPEDFTNVFFEDTIKWDFEKIWTIPEYDWMEEFETVFPVFSWDNLFDEEDDGGGTWIRDDNVPEGENKYKYFGLQLLDFLNDKFYKTSNGLYVESVNSTTLAKGDNSFIWPAAHMINALNWGTSIDAKYKTRLEAYTNKMSWYINGEGYGCIRGGQRFFDDNSLMGVALMRVYDKHIHTQAMLDKSLFAINFCVKYRDEHWGLPQTQNKLGQGIFLLGVSKSIGLAHAIWYTSSKDSAHLATAVKYYDIINDPDLKLQNQKTLIFKNSTQYVDGAWIDSNPGSRAAQTCGVATFALKLYEVTGEMRYLNDARALTDAVLNRWYKPGGGVSEISMWGGSGVVSLLCEMYEKDPDPKWYDAAKDIVNFLIEHTRDKNGFYPTGSTAEFGKWDLERTNTNSPETITFMSQACAANAILQFAHLDLNKENSSGVRNSTQANRDIVIYPNPVKDKLNIKTSNSEVDVNIYSLTGESIMYSNNKQIDVSELTQGIYLIDVRYNGKIFKGRFIKE
jgi:hypothetical protein